MALLTGHGNISPLWRIKKIRTIRFKENRGGNYARNEGLNQSRSELIAFLDDDDYWMPSKLAKQVDAIENEGIDLCYTAKNIVHRRRNSKRYSLIRPRYKNTHKSIMSDNFIGSTSSILIKKSVLEDVGSFDPDLPALQDYDLYIRVIAKGFKIKGITEPLIDYHEGYEKKSISSNLDKFKKASVYLVNKYRNDPYLYLFKRSLRKITLKRIVKSKLFLFGMFKLLFQRLINKSK